MLKKTLKNTIVYKAFISLMNVYKRIENNSETIYGVCGVFLEGRECIAGGQWCWMSGLWQSNRQVYFHHG